MVASPSLLGLSDPVTDATEVDKRTAIDAYQWLREISTALLWTPQIVLGGPGVVVHNDESLFRKVHVHVYMYFWFKHN